MKIGNWGNIQQFEASLQLSTASGRGDWLFVNEGVGRPYAVFLLHRKLVRMMANLFNRSIQMYMHEKC